MDSSEAFSIIEELRFGKPPSTVIQDFTVGRQREIQTLTQCLSDKSAPAVLIKANNGSGKSHLSLLLKHIALRAGYAVSHVEIDTNRGIRFNRMDTILGAISQSTEVGSSKGMGIGELFNAFADCSPSDLDNSGQRTYNAITTQGKWQYTKTSISPSMFIALRAWIFGDSSTRSLVSNWLADPESYSNSRKDLYWNLVARLNANFPSTDQRKDLDLYNFKDPVLTFRNDNYHNAWKALESINNIALACGFKGFVIIFDEFEDVIRSLNNISWRQSAYRNLYLIVQGELSPITTFFTVTPDLINDINSDLKKREDRLFGEEILKQYIALEIDPIDSIQFYELAIKIRDTHSTAFNWSAKNHLKDAELMSLIDTWWDHPAPGRVRHAITTFITLLDRTKRQS